jgi:ferredoxin-NADP reductase
MAERKNGTVIYRQALSPILEIFRIVPQDGTPFPDYKAGQYMALSRDDCRLTRKITDADGHVTYTYDTDTDGNVKRGQVTHSYSISSAPHETKEQRYLEFYVVMEMTRTETPGRLSESLFHIDPDRDNKLLYVNKITGDFTLEKRANGFQNVVLVGTGTGLAPFASMLKEFDHLASVGSNNGMRYTLFHANRTLGELGYHNELLTIEKAHRIDFVYVPSVSRPTAVDMADDQLGKGRANNLLRSVFQMPMKEEEDVGRARELSEADIARAGETLRKAVRPILPKHITRLLLLSRMDPRQTVILTCGNPDVMEDIKYIADANQIKFEKEEW